MSGAFLSRWSRLKQTAKTAAPAPVPAQAQAPTAPAEPVAPRPPLPELDTLGPGSDYSPFLADDVPPDLRREALRRLWASDPALTAPDPFDPHMDDFAAPALVGPIKTAWRFGKGMVTPEEEATEEEAAEETPPPESPLPAGEG